MRLFCRSCDQPNEFPRHWVEATDCCSHCGAKEQWRTINEPKVPYALTHNDRRFLGWLRIVRD